MTSDSVIFKRYSEEVAVCILNRPQKRNALNIELMQQLCAFAEQIERDGKIRVWVLRGNGPAFCAGLDVDEVMDPNNSVESAKMVRQCLSMIYRIPLVTIAMVHGAARGGGAGLVAACDFAVADNNATIGFPEVRRGLVPAQVMSLLIRKLKRADVQELLLSGEPVDAGRAMQMGLFNRMGNMEAEAQKITSQVLQAAPGAVKKTKQLIDQLCPRNLQDDIEMCMLVHMKAIKEAEAEEGIRAFLDKRKPVWEKN
jgi:methylglutaconyl-CoA hydratase